MTLDRTILSGTAHPELAVAIARELGVGLGARTVERFPDGEVTVQIDQPVRGREVFLVQPTSPPVDAHLIELLALADACRRASAARITAVVPYFGYARSDKRHGHREPIAASLVARLIQAVGVAHVVVVDLHTPQIEGLLPGPARRPHGGADPLRGAPAPPPGGGNRRGPRRRPGEDGHPLRRAARRPAGRAAQAVGRRHRDRGDAPRRRRHAAWPA